MKRFSKDRVQAPGLETTGGRVKVSSGPRAPTDGARTGNSAPRRRAVAGKVKVAGAWVNAAELLKPAASRPNSQNTNSPKKKGGGNRPPGARMTL